MVGTKQNVKNDGELIAYYEKHEYRDKETMKMYDI
jgi:hypothetical protein